MIIDDIINIKVNTRNFKMLKEGGYKPNVGQFVNINPYDYTLSKGNFYINVSCDVCSNQKKIKWENYIINTNF